MNEKEGGHKENVEIDPGNEDELSAPSDFSRVTPRNSIAAKLILAPISQPIRPSPPPEQTQSKKSKAVLDENFEDELDLPQPRFSIAIDDGTIDDDSFQEGPPRLSMPLDEADQTGRSIEIGRRAINEQPRGRLSRGSFGSIRASDGFGNASLDGLKDVSKSGTDDSLVGRVMDADGDIDELGDNGGDLDLGGDTEDLRRAMFEESNRNKNQHSDRPQTRPLDPDALSPFILNIPHLAPRESSPVFAPPDEQFDDFDDLQRNEVQTPPVILKESIRVAKPRNRVSKPLKRSRYGIPYPSLPPRITKRIASTFVQSMGTKNSKLGKESLKAIIDASDRYFEQISEDLSAFAQHAGRKKIDESDAIAVMKRQRIVSATSTPFSLAHKHLPGELLQDMRMPLPNRQIDRKKRRLEVIDEDEDEEVDDE
ncbi:hypothetical protein P7C71_g242, partial [Lecanoromycetidae sp. Uapishka_2]